MAESTRNKVATQTGGFLVLVLAIGILVNVFAAFNRTRIDLTQAQRYTLSAGSGRLVSSLKQPLSVDAYVTAGVPFVNTFVDDLVTLLGEYEATGGGKFQYTVIEADTEDLRQQAKDAGLQQLAFTQTEGAGSSVTAGYLGLVLKYGSEQEVIQLHPQMAQGLEFIVGSKMRELRSKVDEVKFKIGVVTDKKELKLSDQNLMRRDPRRPSPTVDAVLRANLPYYEFENVVLSEPIDASLNGLLITQPGDDYTDQELKLIDDFLMLGGKSLAVFAGAANMRPNDATMTATLDTHNLDALLNGYGMELQQDVVVDRQRGLRMTLLSALGAMELTHPAVTMVTDDPRYDEDEALIDTQFAPFFGLQQLSFPFASSIKLNRAVQPADVTLKAVARTSEDAMVLNEPSPQLGLRRDWTNLKGEDAQYVLAATAEGKLQTAFPVEGQEARRAPEISRVMLVASGEFITNPFAYSGNGPDLGPQFAKFGAVGGDDELLMVADAYVQLLDTMIGTLVNTLDWMSGDPELLAATAKFFGEPDLVFPVELPKLEEGDTAEDARRKEEAYQGAKAATQKRIQWTLTSAIPVFFAALGFMRWRSRESKRNDKEGA